MLSLPTFHRIRIQKLLTEADLGGTGDELSESNFFVVFAKNRLINRLAPPSEKSWIQMCLNTMPMYSKTQVRDLKTKASEHDTPASALFYQSKQKLIQFVDL